mmetsp:Transcript_184609/g.585513  ORF Transcript_184609/g.585513 Transcript_184609/m.585513 type:complete len:345 (-) Transcript_184609:785-1819(-)
MKLAPNHKAFCACTTSCIVTLRRTFSPLAWGRIVNRGVHREADKVANDGGNENRLCPRVGLTQGVACVCVAADAGQSPEGGRDAIHQASVATVEVRVAGIQACQREVATGNARAKECDRQKSRHGRVGPRGIDETQRPQAEGGHRVADRLHQLPDLRERHAVSPKAIGDGPSNARRDHSNHARQNREEAATLQVVPKCLVQVRRRPSQQGIHTPIVAEMCNHDCPQRCASQDLHPRDVLLAGFSASLSALVGRARGLLLVLPEHSPDEGPEEAHGTKRVEHVRPTEVADHPWSHQQADDRSGILASSQGGHSPAALLLGHPGRHDADAGSRRQALTDADKGAAE